MESREEKVIFGKNTDPNRQQDYHCKVFLPRSWVETMGIDKDKNSIRMSFQKDQITIEKYPHAPADKLPLASNHTIHRKAIMFLGIMMSYHNLPGFIFEACLGEEMHELGFIMDCGKSIEAAFPGRGDLLDVKEFKEILPFIDIQTLGNAIFSNWRYWTHWTTVPMGERSCQWFIMAFKRLAELTET